MTDLITLSTETFKKHWSLLQSALKGYKPLRIYESYALLESDGTHFVLRVTNETGGMKITLSADDQPQLVVIACPFAIAIKIDDVNRILPYLDGSMTLQMVDDKQDVVAFTTAMITQHLQWSSQVVEDFPSEVFFSMQERVRFVCADFDRRLRLAKNSATNDAKQAWSLSSSLCIQIKDNMVQMQSAHSTRGVSRIMWTPEALEVSGDPLLAIIALPCVDALARSAQGYTGPIVITSDAGGNMVAFRMGRLELAFRVVAQKFFSVDMMFGGEVVAEASVPHAPFLSVVGLIAVQTAADRPAQAKVVLEENDKVHVYSPSTPTTTEAFMSGTISGEVPSTFSMNARQIHEILSDLRATQIVHLSARRIGSNPILHLTAPSDPEYIHVAILMSEKAMPRQSSVETNADAED